MRDAYSVLFGIAAMVGVWVTVVTLISYLGGWASLADQYRCRETFTGPRWRFQCGQFRWFVSYNNCLIVGADPRGLFLAIFPLFRIAHPPLFIPWREISVSRKEILWFKQVRFQLGHELKISLTIRDGLAQKLQSAAGASWSVESVA